MVGFRQKIRLLGNLSYSFSCDQQGASAVEFVLVFPLILGLYLMTVSLSIGAIIAVKSDSVARTSSSLFASQATFDVKDFQGLANLIKVRLTPYQTDKATFKLTAIKMTARGQGVVLWSRDNTGGTPYSKNLPITHVGILSSPFYIRTEIGVPYKMLGAWPLNGKDVAPSIVLPGDDIVASSLEAAPTCAVCK